MLSGERLRALQLARPDIDWRPVRFVEGLPWWARSGTRGMVVPTLRGARVHLTSDDPALLLHEAEHVAQLQRMGAVRFTVTYLALAARYGFGRAHPMERPAYAAAKAAERDPRRLLQ